MLLFASISGAIYQMWDTFFHIQNKRECLLEKRIPYLDFTFKPIFELSNFGIHSSSILIHSVFILCVRSSNFKLFFLKQLLNWHWANFGKFWYWVTKIGRVCVLLSIQKHILITRLWIRSLNSANWSTMVLAKPHFFLTFVTYLIGH
jgi:hypothetical protein